MSNERVTENLVRDRLRSLGCFDTSNNVKVDEQKSGIEAVTRLLKQASKTGGGGKGAPEFIISNPDDPDFLVIVECKADTKDHVSSTIPAMLSGAALADTSDDYARRVVRFAADGALHYARHLSKDYSVIAVAVSGQTESALKVTTYLHTRGAMHPKILTTKSGLAIEQVIPWFDYIEHATFDPAVQAVRLYDLMAFSHDLHDFMRDDVKASESEKPLFVSGTLIALRNKAFAQSYDAQPVQDLPGEWLRIIKTEMRKADMPNSKQATITAPYTNIASHPELYKPHRKYPKGVLNELIRRLNEKVWPFISVYHDFDVVGQFYGEFLKYTGGDKKALGIVLTPRHITELFALLANVNKDSKVLDICAGTGGFLISAMHQMFKTALTEEEKTIVKQEGLVGIEQQPNMFALAASNMLLRGDGKANLHQSDCFDEQVTAAVKKRKCDVGLLNPPFAQGDDDGHELYFVNHMLNCLEKGGVGVAIVPMNCAVAPHKAKAELMKHHTLEAVMSLPDELFAPVGIISSIMVFTAKIPHAVSKRRSWFGYWKKDGFVRTKHRGRIDSDGSWPSIRDHWVQSFRNREILTGESVSQTVGPNDEWCAEAYMETDYTTLTREDFERELRKYVAFRILHAEGEDTNENDATEQAI